MSINDEIEELNHEIGALEYEIMLKKKEKHQLIMKKAQMMLDKEDEKSVK